MIAGVMIWLTSNNHIQEVWFFPSSMTFHNLIVYLTQSIFVAVRNYEISKLTLDNIYGFLIVATIYWNWIVFVKTLYVNYL